VYHQRGTPRPIVVSLKRISSTTVRTNSSVSALNSSPVTQAPKMRRRCRLAALPPS